MIANSLITSLSTALVVTAALSNAASATTKSPLEPQADIGSVTTGKPEKLNPSEAKGLLALGKIETEVENDLTLITAKLNKLPTWKTLEIEDHGTFIQIKMPGTTIESSGEFFDGTGPYLKKIASFQVGENDGALRLFLNQDAAKAKLATTAELLGERIVITIDHKKLEQLITPSSAKEAASNVASNMNSAKSDDVKSTPASSPSDSAAAAPTVVGATQVQTPVVEVSAGPDSLNLKDKLMTAAAFCAAMLLFLLGSTLYRNKRIKGLKAAKLFDSVEPAPMKVLSNLSVSGRQRLSLVQVGSQQILIGISPDNISFLTEVTPKARQQSAQQSFSNHLLHSDPNAEVKLKQADVGAQRPSRKPSDAATAQRPNVTAKQIQPTNRVNVRVGDDGVSDLRSRGVKNDRGSADQPFDDITKIIRDRLKNLPPAP